LFGCRKTEVLLKKWNNDYSVSIMLTSPSGVTYSLSSAVGGRDAEKLVKGFGVEVFQG